jgi:DNA-binding MarR family transcriptional regulator
VGESTDEAVFALEAQMTELWRSGRVRIRELARRLHPALDPATFPLLAVLVRHGNQRVSDLSTLLELDKSTVSRQIDAAARVGLVERVADPGDARVRRVELTAEGRERMGALHDEELARWRASLATWDPADLQRLTELLRRLADTGVT